MRVLSLFLIALFSATVMLGCGSLFNEKATPVQMNSNPTGAAVWVDGNRVGTTPTSVDLSNSSEHTVTFRMDGQDDVTCIINKKVGGGWVVLDVLGGLIPIIVDAATGSWYELDRTTCNADFGDGVDLDNLSPRLQDRYSGIY